jgi:hypothetical protein
VDKALLAAGRSANPHGQAVFFRKLHVFHNTMQAVAHAQFKLPRALNYQAVARKLMMRERYLDESVPRPQVAAELADLAATYESLRDEFKRLWLAQCKDAGSFPRYLKDYDKTIVPCRTKSDGFRNR